MDHSIVLRLTPVFAGEPPLIRVDINGNTIFHNKLKTEEEIKHVTAITSSVKIKITHTPTPLHMPRNMVESLGRDVRLRVHREAPPRGSCRATAAQALYSRRCRAALSVQVGIRVAPEAP